MSFKCKEGQKVKFFIEHKKPSEPQTITEHVGIIYSIKSHLARLTEYYIQCENGEKHIIFNRQIIEKLK